MDERFEDRREAGRALADRLMTRAALGPVVVGLTRGGVPVAAEVAERLGAPLDFLVVRKLGAPGCPEVAIGAIAEGGEIWFEPGAQSAAGGTWIRRETKRQEAELRRRLAFLRPEIPPLPVASRAVILVDDGVATGATASAAMLALRRRGASRVILAAPVAASEAARELARRADETVFLVVPEYFDAVGRWYEDFSPVSDEDVLALLRDARRREFA
ncbi:MAG: phosphoribosyltransferase [Elusimicrobia bacterium]|nr:phosphoribosyltransferase [Elusimicrobiota bacterium]